MFNLLIYTPNPIRSLILPTLFFCTRCRFVPVGYRAAEADPLPTRDRMVVSAPAPLLVGEPRIPALRCDETVGKLERCWGQWKLWACYTLPAYKSWEY